MEAIEVLCKRIMYFILVVYCTKSHLEDSILMLAPYLGSRNRSSSIRASLFCSAIACALPYVRQTWNATPSTLFSISGLFSAFLALVPLACHLCCWFRVFVFCFALEVVCTLLGRILRVNRRNRWVERQQITMVQSRIFSKAIPRHCRGG